MLLIDGFNKSCNNLSTSYLKVRYESMSVISFWNTAKVDLQHLSYIFCNMEPLGTDSNTVSCYVNDALLFFEIQRGKERINNRNYHMYIRATAAYTNRTMKSKNGVGQRDVKGATKESFLLDSWFSSKNLA